MYNIPQWNIRPTLSFIGLCSFIFISICVRNRGNHGVTDQNSSVNICKTVHVTTLRTSEKLLPGNLYNSITSDCDYLQVNSSYIISFLDIPDNCYELSVPVTIGLCLI